MGFICSGICVIFVQTNQFSRGEVEVEVWHEKLISYSIINILLISCFICGGPIENLHREVYRKGGAKGGINEGLGRVTGNRRVL